MSELGISLPCPGTTLLNALLALGILLAPWIQLRAAEKADKPKGQVKVWKKHHEAAMEALKGNDYATGKLELEAALAEARAIKTNDFHVATSLDDLGRLHQDMRNWREAIELFRQGAAVQASKWGTNHATVAYFQQRLGFCLAMNKQYAEAEEVQLACRKLLGMRYGAFHPRVGEVLNGLGITYTAEGKYPEAQEALTSALKILTSEQTYSEIDTSGVPQTYVYTPSPSTYAHVYHNLAMLYAQQRKFEESDKAYEECLAKVRSGRGAKAALQIPTLNNWALGLLQRKAPAEAESKLKVALACLEKNKGPDLPYLKDTLRLLVIACSQQGKNEEATSYKEKLAGLEK